MLKRVVSWVVGHDPINRLRLDSKGCWIESYQECWRCRKELSL